MKSPPYRLYPLIIGLGIILQMGALFSLYPTQRVTTFSVAGGLFDLLREKHRTSEFSVEGKFYIPQLDVSSLLDIRPLVGVMSTVQGSGYLYGGINFDLFLGGRLIIAPGFAAGYYWAGGQGKELGYPLEFRSGVELGWLFAESYRFGVHFYHLSNAGLGSKNPGEESLVLYYEIPLFPARKSL